MKTLSQHISQVKTFHSFNEFIEEKLIINKDFKKCLDDKPNVNGGLFLRLQINTCSNNTNNRIDIEIEKYKFKGNRFKDNCGYYKKNKKGYYWTDERFGGMWIELALIGTDAINFLNTLLKDVHQTFDLLEYFDASQQKLIDLPKRNVYIHDFELTEPTKSNIKNMIDKLYENIT